MNRVRMTCQRCGREREYAADILREVRRRGAHQSAEIDWDAGIGTYDSCGTCTRGDTARAMNRALMSRGVIIDGKRRRGAVVLVMRGKRLKATRTDAELAAALEAAHDALRGRVQGSDERRRHAIAGIRPTRADFEADLLAGRVSMPAKGFWGFCLGCDAINWNRKKPTARHGECERRLRKATMSSWGEMPPRERKRERGRPKDDGDLAQTFAMCVLKLLRSASWAELADMYSPPEETIPEETLKSRMRTFVDRLPTDGQGSRELSFWSETLRAARDRV